MSSNHSVATSPGYCPDNVAKADLNCLVQILAIVLAPAIRTVGLAPGFVDTPGNQTWFNSFADSVADNKINYYYPSK